MLLEENEKILKIQQGYIRETVNKITLSASFDKILQMQDEGISYSYGTGCERVCKSELIERQRQRKNQYND